MHPYFYQHMLILPTLESSNAVRSSLSNDSVNIIAGNVGNFLVRQYRRLLVSSDPGARCMRRAAANWNCNLDMLRDLLLRVNAADIDANALDQK